MPTGYPRLAAIAALGLLGAIYVFRGLEALIIHGSDLKLYWDQFHSALAGHNPYDLGNASTAYPPFFLETLPFYWPAWPFAKYYFTGITLASLAYVMNWAYRLGAKESPLTGALLAVSIPAASSISPGLAYGQNAILFTALLVGVLELYEAKRTGLAALLLAIALSKINIAALFVLPFLFRKEWRVLAITAGVLVIATGMLCLWVGQSPITLTLEWLTVANWQACGGYGPAVYLCEWGVPPDKATLACELAILPIAVGVFAYARKFPLLAQFGLAAGFGRLWTYHRAYDNFMLVILLIALAHAYLETKRGPLGLTALVMGLSLWLLPRTLDFQAVQAAQLLVWAAAVAILAVYAGPPRFHATTEFPASGTSQSFPQRG